MRAPPLFFFSGTATNQREPEADVAPWRTDSQDSAGDDDVNDADDNDDDDDDNADDDDDDDDDNADDDDDDDDDNADDDDDDNDKPTTMVTMAMTI